MFKRRLEFSQEEGHFADKGGFRNKRGISQVVLQLISQLRTGIWGLRNGTRVPRGGFAAVKIFTVKGLVAAKLFCRGTLFSQGDSFGYEIFSQGDPLFAGWLFCLQNFRRGINSSVFVLLWFPEASLHFF